MGRLCIVLKNPGFSSLLIVFSLLSVASMAFIASSSYIYINGFGLSEQVYSYYFALNALGMIGGPMLYMRLSKKYKRTSIIFTCFVAVSFERIIDVSPGRSQSLVFCNSDAASYY